MITAQISRRTAVSPAERRTPVPRSHLLLLRNLYLYATWRRATGLWHLTNLTNCPPSVREPVGIATARTRNSFWKSHVRRTSGTRGESARDRSLENTARTLAHSEGSSSSHSSHHPHLPHPFCPCAYCQTSTAVAAASSSSVDPSHHIMEQHYAPYHHPYYRVGAGVKDHHHHHHHHHQTVESAAQAAAVQSRILEMRKEKSRDAARSRRGKENHEFYELAKLLPLPAAITSQLDKASIIRLTISYLKLRDFTQNGEPTWNLPGPSGNSLKNAKLCKPNNVFDAHQGTHILQSLDGFAFALGSDGRFLYISETVSIYLGLSQVEMTGSSLFDYVHVQDHAELADVLGINLSQSSSGHMSAASPLPPASVASNASSESESTGFASMGNVMTMSGPHDTVERQFCIRMKSTLTKRGCQHFKSSGYRVVHVVSHLRLETQHQQQPSQRRDSSSTSPPKVMGLVALAIALPPPSVNELRLESDMFIARLSLDFKVLHVEPRVSELLEYSPDELVGRSIYSLIYGQDIVQIRKCHSDLMHKGQVMTKYYRFLNKNGGFTWIQSCATLINSSSSSSAPSAANNGKSPTGSSSTTGEEPEQCIIFINYIISGTEQNDVIMDCGQLPEGTFDLSSSSPCITLSKQRTPPRLSRSPSSSPPVTRPARHDKQSSSSSAGSPASPTGDCKRRRFTSSPVRPWKSPSPADHPHDDGTPHTTPASNLLRHISVIRETPPILKPQVMAASYHHHAAHHYHPLVDPYAAAYHLYKSTPSPGGAMAAGAAAATAGHPHHWGSYN